MDTRPTSNSQEKSPTPAERLSALRAQMKTAGIDGFLVPHGDEHQGEYSAPFAERLKWLTGFSGSAGLSIVLKDRAVIFVDGRYTIQVKTQVDGTLYEYAHLVDDPPPKWVEKNLSSGAKLGFDPRLHTPQGLARFEQAVKKVSADLAPVDENLVDNIWTDQPPRPTAPLRIYPEKFAGRSSAEKRELVAKVLESEGLDAFLISALDSVAWLLNIRGDDMEFSPLAYAYVLMTTDGAVTLLVDPAKLTDDVRAHLGDDVSIAPYDGLPGVLKNLAEGVKIMGVDKNTASRWAVDLIKDRGRRPVPSTDPCAALKARKHPSELAGVREAHVRDGAALTRFLAWLSIEGPKGTLNEVSAADRLETIRAESNLYLGPSFPTIAGAGGNGAIVHYRAHPDTAAAIKPDMLFLVDSGGQYLDGTTDVTRTVAIGTPTTAQIRHFTLVLKGHIALARARFVTGTAGNQLDTLARAPLWEDGLDYDHGTGHGVGTYLGVHEGPQNISKRPINVPLEPGMVVSNEPGYYRTGEYGIRIENLVTVVDASAPDGAERPLLEFETITLAPIDLSLVDPELLTASEKAWLNTYHAKVRKALSPILDEATRAWMEQATEKV